MESNPNKFVIRVYGIFINQNYEVLLSDEYMLNMKMTKFPGGGMNFGEGPIECLKREIMEEMNGQEIEIIDHFYTTDYYQPAYFFDNHQLISIYYLARFIEPIKFKISSIPFDFDDLINGNQSFRWKNILEISEKELTFPIDQKVVSLLKSKKDL
ncbi:MAG: NUDIX domain-containing protein [Bacteroidales bacterium]|jgi:ADP-ribose pyrophosphatase YjhB (NUDIX family)|nr:NUDIX domain-containing protein [Bacteroidales bacterium]